MVCQAASFDGVLNATEDAPRWDAHSRLAFALARSLAKLWMKTFFLRYSSDASAGASGKLVVKNSWAGVFLVRMESAPLS